MNDQFRFCDSVLKYSLSGHENGATEELSVFCQMITNLNPDDAVAGSPREQIYRAVWLEEITHDPLPCYCQ